MNDLEQKLDRLQAAVDALSTRLERLAAYLEAAPGVRTGPVEEHVGLVRLASGHRLYVDTRDIGIASHLMTTGQWERNHTAIMRRLVQRGQICVDIGANFGYYSVIMGSLVRTGGAV